MQRFVFSVVSSLWEMRRIEKATEKINEQKVKRKKVENNGKGKTGNIGNDIQGLRICKEGINGDKRAYG